VTPIIEMAPRKLYTWRDGQVFNRAGDVLGAAHPLLIAFNFLNYRFFQITPPICDFLFFFSFSR
jgi:hypothetical protein